MEKLVSTQNLWKSFGRGILVLRFLIVARHHFRTGRINTHVHVSWNNRLVFHVRPYPLENSGSRPLSHR